MAEEDEILKEIGNLSTKIGALDDKIDTKISVLDDKIEACSKGIDSLVKINKEKWALINDNKNRIVKLEAKSEVEEKKKNHNFLIKMAIAGVIGAVLGSLIGSFVINVIIK